MGIICTVLYHSRSILVKSRLYTKCLSIMAYLFHIRKLYSLDCKPFRFHTLCTILMLCCSKCIKGKRHIFYHRILELRLGSQYNFLSLNRKFDSWGSSYILRTSSQNILDGSKQCMCIHSRKFRIHIYKPFAIYQNRVLLGN